MSEKVDRRGYLKVAGGLVVGVAVGAAGGYYGRSPGPATIQTVTETLTKTVTQKVEATPTPTPTEKLVYVNLSGPPKNPYWALFNKGVIETTDFFGIERLDLQTEDATEQLQNAEDALLRGANLAGLVPMSSEFAPKLMQLFDDNGVFFTLAWWWPEEIYEDPTKIKNYPYCGIASTGDLVEYGYLEMLDLAEEVKKKTGDYKGNIVAISGELQWPAGALKSEGLHKGLDEFPDITLLEEVSGGGNVEGGRKVMEDYLVKYSPGEVDGCHTDNDGDCIGAVQALKAANRLGEFPITTMDAGQEALEYVVDGTVAKMLVFDPYIAGMTTVTGALDRYYGYPQEVKMWPVFSAGPKEAEEYLDRFNQSMFGYDPNEVSKFAKSGPAPGWSPSWKPS